MIRRHSRITITNVPLIQKDYIKIIREMMDGWHINSYARYRQGTFFLHKAITNSGITTTKMVTNK